MSLGRVLVLGGTGQVGRALLARLGTDVEVRAPSRSQVDLADGAKLRAYVEAWEPAVVVNAAAVSDVDACTRDPSRAWSVNACGPIALAKVCADVGAQLVHLSTDYVFDGMAAGPEGYRESDPPHPLQTYGRTKRAAEDGILDVFPEALIVRTAWVFGGGGRSDLAARLLAWGREAMPAEQSVRLAEDQRSSPTFVDDLVEALLILVRQRARGIVHIVNSGGASRWDFGVTLYAAVGLPVSVERVSAATFSTAARRPLDTRLCNERARSLGALLRPWEEAVKEAAARYRAADA